MLAGAGVTLSLRETHNHALVGTDLHVCCLYVRFKVYSILLKFPIKFTQPRKVGRLTTVVTARSTLSCVPVCGIMHTVFSWYRTSVYIIVYSSSSVLTAFGRR